jgi:hypothetical protein
MSAAGRFRASPADHAAGGGPSSGISGPILLLFVHPTACCPAPGRLQVQLPQVMHGGMEMPLALAGGEAAHGELPGTLVVLHLAEHRLYRGATQRVARASALRPQLALHATTRRQSLRHPPAWRCRIAQLGPLLAVLARGDEQLALLRLARRVLLRPVAGIAAGMVFGALLSMVPLALGIALAGAEVTDAVGLALAILLGALAFTVLGVLMVAPATDRPSQVMMLSNLVRLPLIFVSGVFVPLAAMPEWGQALAPSSPLAYSTDLIRAGLGGARHFCTVASVMVLLGFGAGFLILARLLQGASQSKSR